jgi:hypothetical protein
MIDTDAVLPLTVLPADATYAEAILWLEKMRRVVDRWDDLPDAHRCSMTPQGKREAHAELDLLEDKIRRDMAAVS